VSAAERPWWATDGDDAPDDPTDPMEAHRAARRGAATPDDGEPHHAADPGDPREDVEDGAGSRTRPVDDGSWWVPATEAVTRLARDLAASPPRGLLDDDGHRRDATDAAAEEGTSWTDAGSRPGAGPRDGSGGGGGHRIDACGVCPICVGLRALGEARPDLVGHLAEAARQLALAVRTVVDATAPADEAGDPDGAPGPSGRSGRGGDRRRPAREDLRRIDLDD
jgi:hypothetical protein